MSRLVPALIVLLGVTQMTADLAGVKPLAALAFATCLSPAPKVFTTQAGYEGFSTELTLDVYTADGARTELAMTPERYAHVRGPYNRRNALGAALVGAPFLRSEPRLAPMLHGVTQHALCGDAPLLRELDVPLEAPVTRVRVRFRTRAGVESPADVEVVCR